MYKIGEFSRLSQVSVRMLRHYDKLGLLTPSHTDSWTGYRYYTIDQLPRLNRIVALNGLGLTLQQITDLLDQNDEPSPEELRGMLTMRRAAIEQELADVQMQLISVEARLRQIENEAQGFPYDIVIKSAESLPVASVRQTVPNASEMGFYCELLYDRLYKRLAYYNIEPGEPELIFYHGEEYRETDLEVEAATVVEPDVLEEEIQDDLLSFRRTPPAEEAASLVYQGPLSEMLPAVLALFGWIGQQQMMIAGPLHEIHRSSRAHPEDGEPAGLITELLVPIQPAEG